MVRRLLFLMASFVLLGGIAVQAQDIPTYIGSEACGDCHPGEYENFTKYAKKAQSWNSIQLMTSDLSPVEIAGCYACHTTGYNKPGGFKNAQETPHLKNAGCEVCHGPGSLHQESFGDPSLIKGQLALTDCESCHNKDRVNSFNFKPLLHGGAH